MLSRGASIEEAIRDIREIVGEEHVLENRADVLDFAIATDPAGDVFPSAVVFPANESEVQRIVTVANKRRVPIHSISTGFQHGLGMATAVEPGAITMVLRRMNRIHDYDPNLGYVVVEPGVTFQQLADFLRVQGSSYWISPTSGPVHASVIGNALDKGAGYTPMGNNFANLIGLDVVLGDGRCVTFGDGMLPGAKSAFTHKGGFGPMLDQLMAQSNFAIVTRAGVWLMPAPEGARGFVFSFPNLEDLSRAVDTSSRLKLTGLIPSTVSIVNDQFCAALEAERPVALGSPGTSPFSDALLADLRAQHRFGAWNVVGCVYGKASILESRVEDLLREFEETGPVNYRNEEDARQSRAFNYRFDIAKGIPNETEVSLYEVHNNGTAMSFLPSVPFNGTCASEAAKLSSSICTEHGFAYLNQFLCSPRSMRNTQHIVFDRSDRSSRERAGRCFEEHLKRFQAAGYLVSRPPARYQPRLMVRFSTHQQLLSGIKKVFDPNGVISPGRYGIGGENNPDI